MALVDVIQCCLDSIRQISKEIEDSIIYLDAGCTESFQFLGAFPLLLELGVRAVCSLEKMSSLDLVADWNSKSDPPRKIVIFTSRLLSDAHRYILRCLSMHHSFCRCTVYTSVSEIAHSAYPDSPLGPDAFHEYESLLVQDYEELTKRSGTYSRQSGDADWKESITPGDEGWPQLTSRLEEISNFDTISSAKDSYEDDPLGHAEDVGQKLVVSVLHFPLILCPLSPRVFVLPSEGSVAEAYLSVQHENSISPGLPPLSTGSGTAAEGEDTPPGATLTAQFLYHMATKMDLKLEIFSLGDLSKTIGKLLTDMSSLYDGGRRKRSAGLLLIDRTLDLLTPCCHGDSLVDSIFSSLPRRERTSNSMKSSQNQLKHGHANLKRAPLDARIPLANVVSEEESSTKNFRLLERMEAFLRGWNSSDASSQMVELINLSSKLNDEKSFHSGSDLLCGSFDSTVSFHGAPYLQSILDRSTKDGAVLIKKWLQETLRRDNIHLNVKIRPGFASKSELHPMVKALAENESSIMRNQGIIQLAAATLYALDELHGARWLAFNSAEKMLKVSVGDTSQGLAAQISDLINKSSSVGSQGQQCGKMERSQRLITFQDSLLLTVIGYVLAGENFPTSGSGGPFSWQEEHFMKEAIVDAVLENPALAKIKFLEGLTEELEANVNRNKLEEVKQGTSNLQSSDDFDDDDQWGSWGDEDADRSPNKEKVYDDLQLKLDLRDRVDNLSKFFHKLSSSNRSILWRERSLGSDPYSSKGLLYKLLTKVLAKYDVPGLEYHSSTVGRLFKSGFGRFGLGQAKPNLADHNVILVFVVGGISGVEVREAQDALSESGRADIEMILGGTTLLTPNDMLDLLLLDSSYF